jgi:hypothetical protein
MGAGGSIVNGTDDYAMTGVARRALSTVRQTAPPTPARVADVSRPLAEVTLAAPTAEATPAQLAEATPAPILTGERKEDQDGEDAEPQSMSAPLPRAGRGHIQYQEARELSQGERKVQDAVVPPDEKIEITWDTQPNDMEAMSIMSVFPSVPQAINLFKLDGLELYQTNAYHQLKREFADEYINMRTQNPFLPPPEIKRMMMRLFKKQYRKRMKDIFFDDSPI